MLIAGFGAIALVVGASLLALSGAFAPPPTPLTSVSGSVIVFTKNTDLLKGSLLGGPSNFVLEDFQQLGNLGSPCHATGGFDDIAPGRDVTLYGPKDEVLGKAPLGAGSLVKNPNPGSLPGGSFDVDTLLQMAEQQSTWGCRFNFEIKGVPEVANVTLEIGTRGRLTFTLDELRASGWHLETNLGLTD